ncbi:hypothetical protein ATK86_4948 [Nocardia fluminea]|uniref:Uncharacterized protein n=1 Tax=Nocardia fluminea TaxID=134984 RepID=A0A2N3VFW3_9NOCA|nr:hypothetical protein ATK86_4948 [Nocardia fluminea]
MRLLPDTVGNRRRGQPFRDSLRLRGSAMWLIVAALTIVTWQYLISLGIST